MTAYHDVNVRAIDESEDECQQLKQQRREYHRLDLRDLLPCTLDILDFGLDVTK
jgi:hypothetical protein